MTNVPCEYRQPSTSHVPAERLSEDERTRTWVCRDCGTELRPKEGGGFAAVPDPRHRLFDSRVGSPS